MFESFLNYIFSLQKIPNIVSQLKEKEIAHVACGADFTIVIDANGKIYGWGQNDGGQVFYLFIFFNFSVTFQDFN